MSGKQENHENQGEHKGPNNPEPHIQVAVITTAGSYPPAGHDSTPIRQKVRVLLEKVARELRLTDTSRWVAKVGGRELNIDETYMASGLTGVVEIDWGPREGGGGVR